MNAHYEVRKTGSIQPEYRTGGSTEAAFERACRQARVLSSSDPLAYPGSVIRYEVRYRGYTEPAKDLLVAAAQGGEMLDVRTRQAEDEHLSR